MAMKVRAELPLKVDTVLETGDVAFNCPLDFLLNPELPVTVAEALSHLAVDMDIVTSNGMVRFSIHEGACSFVMQDSAMLKDGVLVEASPTDKDKLPAAKPIPLPDAEPAIIDVMSAQPEPGEIM